MLAAFVAGCDEGSGAIEYEEFPVRDFDLRAQLGPGWLVGAEAVVHSADFFVLMGSSYPIADGEIVLDQTLEGTTVRRSGSTTWTVTLQGYSSRFAAQPDGTTLVAFAAPQSHLTPAMPGGKLAIIGPSGNADVRELFVMRSAHWPDELPEPRSGAIEPTAIVPMSDGGFVVFAQTWFHRIGFNGWLYPTKPDGVFDSDVFDGGGLLVLRFDASGEEVWRYDEQTSDWDRPQIRVLRATRLADDTLAWSGTRVLGDYNEQVYAHIAFGMISSAGKPLWTNTYLLSNAPTEQTRYGTALKMSRQLGFSEATSVTPLTDTLLFAVRRGDFGMPGCTLVEVDLTGREVGTQVSGINSCIVTGTALQPRIFSDGREFELVRP